jgi:hypothetical protein
VRGSNIAEIDEALQDWDTIPLTASADIKMAALSRIISACKAWIRKKEGKKGVPAAVLPGQTESLYAKRYRAIKALANQAVQQLFLLDPNLGAAHALFQFKKATAGVAAGVGVPAVATMPKRAMAPGYLNERRSYLDFNKQRALSGSVLHEVIDDAADPTLRSNDKKKAKAQTKVGKIMRNRTFDSLTPQEYQAIGALAGDLRNQGAEVKYFTKLERLKMMATADANGLLVDYQSNPLNSGNGVWPFAIDRYGNLFFARDNPPPGYARFNHSSFNAGNDVICAGTMRILNGQLMSFNNNSGHYKPDRTNLSNALIVIRDVIGADMSQAEIEYWDAVSSPTHIIINVYTITNFVNAGAPSQTAQLPKT